jgi:hypothetical protein
VVRFQRAPPFELLAVPEATLAGRIPQEAARLPLRAAVNLNHSSGLSTPSMLPVTFTPTTSSTTSSAIRLALSSIANAWRGLFSLSLGLTLCALAVAESTGEANAPTWFLGFAIPVLTE